MRQPLLFKHFKSTVHHHVDQILFGDGHILKKCFEGDRIDRGCGNVVAEPMQYLGIDAVLADGIERYIIGDALGAKHIDAPDKLIGEERADAVTYEHKVGVMLFACIVGKALRVFGQSIGGAFADTDEIEDQHRAASAEKTAYLIAMQRERIGAALP